MSLRIYTRVYIYVTFTFACSFGTEERLLPGYYLQHLILYITGQQATEDRTVAVQVLLDKQSLK